MFSDIRRKGTLWLPPGDLPVHAGTEDGRPRRWPCHRLPQGLRAEQECHPPMRGGCSRTEPLHDFEDIFRRQHEPPLHPALPSRVLADGLPEPARQHEKTSLQERRQEGREDGRMQGRWNRSFLAVRFPQTPSDAQGFWIFIQSMALRQE